MYLTNEDYLDHDRNTKEPSEELGKGDFASTLKDPFATARSPSGEYFATRTSTSAPDRHESVSAGSPVFSDSGSPPPRRESVDRRMSKEWGM